MEINKEATRFLAYYPTFIEEHKNKKRYKNTRRYNTRKIKTFERNIYTQKIQKANNKAQAKKQAINSANQTKKEVFQLLSTLQTDKDESVRALVAKNAAQLADPTKALKLLEKIIKYEHKQSKQSKSYRYSYPSIKNTLIESIVKIHQETTAFLTYLGNKKEQKKQVFYRRKNYTGIYLQIIRYAKNKEKAEKQAINLAYQTKKKVFQLLNILAKDKAVEVRSTVVHSIKEIKNPIESLKLLENMIKIENKYSSKKNSYGVKNKAIKASLTIYKRAQNFLVNLGLQTKKQRKKRQHIYGTQGKIGIYKQMIQISTNKKKAKQQAINLAHQTKKKIFQLLNILAKDKEPSVRKQVVEGLPFIDELDAFDLLEKLMKDQDRDVRILAIQAIGKIN